MHRAMYCTFFLGITPKGPGTANTSDYRVLSYRELIRDSCIVKAEVLFMWEHIFWRLSLELNLFL